MAISLPTPELTWRFQLNTRITYTSVLQCSGDCIYTIITRLIAEGWTCKGSCDGTTGAMDGTNRITAGNKFQTRFSGSAGAQSWIVLTDGDGADIVFSFNSAADDRVNFWWSPKGIATVAGTATNEPTATDQSRVTAFFTTNFISMVGSGTSSDRLVNIWTTADHKNFRVAIARANAWVICFGKESYTPATLASGITLHPGFAFMFPGDSFTAQVGVANRGILEQCTTVSAAGTDQFRCLGYETDGGGFALDLARYTTICGIVGAATNPTLSQTLGTVQLPLQGGASYALRRLGLISGTSGHEGFVGKMKDWYYGHLDATIGSGVAYGTFQWYVMNGVANGAGFIWPGDGATGIVMS
jgi:hypothetical protein